MVAPDRFAGPVRRSGPGKGAGMGYAFVIDEPVGEAVRRMTGEQVERAGDAGLPGRLFPAEADLIGDLRAIGPR